MRIASFTGLARTSRGREGRGGLHGLLVHVLLDGAYRVRADEGVPAEAPTVDRPYRHRRTIQLTIGQFDVNVLDRHGEIRILLHVRDDRRVNNVTGTLDVHSRLVDAHQMQPLEVPQAPK